MKKSIFLIAVLMLTSLLSSSTLFVIDEYTGYQNYQTIRIYLENAGVAFSTHDVAEQGALSIDILNQYDLVIWYCSHSGAGLGFWNGTDSDNAALMAYLDGGGKLWVMGTDILYDRYGAAPVTFSAGSFVYDYLGVASYNCQSYANDSSSGLPRLNYVANTHISNLPDLTWIYPTSWYVDGVTPIATATSIYQMGPAGYTLAGNTSAVLLPPQTSPDDKAVLSFFFDPYEIGVASDADTLFSHVIAYFENLIGTGNDDAIVPTLQAKITNYPNPFCQETTISYELPKTGKLEISIYNLKGQKLSTLKAAEQQKGKHQMVFNAVDDSQNPLPKGIYLLSLKQDGKTAAVRKVMRF